MYIACSLGINTKYFLVGSLFATTLISCNQDNKLASSFGKRKYTKGFYLDVASSVKHSTPEQSFSSSRVKCASKTIVTNVSPKQMQTEVNAVINNIGKEKAKTVYYPGYINRSLGITQKIASVGSKGKMQNDENVTGGYHDKVDSDFQGFGIIGCCFVIISELLGLGLLVSGGTDIALYGVLGVFFFLGIIFCVVSLVKHEYRPYYAVLGLAFALLTLAGLLISVAASSG